MYPMKTYVCRKMYPMKICGYRLHVPLDEIRFSTFRDDPNNSLFIFQTLQYLNSTKLDFENGPYRPSPCNLVFSSALS